MSNINTLANIEQDLKNLEDTEEVNDKNNDDIVPRDDIPTYHWSMIHVPRMSEAISCLTIDKIALTQKVHLLNEPTKLNQQHSAIVLYDIHFLEYKLLEVIASLICEVMAETESDSNASIADSLLEQLADSLGDVIKEVIFRAVEYHDNAIETCNEIGVDLRYLPKMVIRSFKLAKARDAKREQANIPVLRKTE